MWIDIVYFSWCFDKKLFVSLNTSQEKCFRTEVKKRPQRSSPVLSRQWVNVWSVVSQLNCGGSQMNVRQVLFPGTRKGILFVSTRQILKSNILATLPLQKMTREALWILEAPSKLNIFEALFDNLICMVSARSLTAEIWKLTRSVVQQTTDHFHQLIHILKWIHSTIAFLTLTAIWM